MTADISTVKKYIYLFFLCLLVAVLPLSRYMMSISQFSLMALWVFEGVDTKRFKQRVSNSAFLLVLITEIGSSIALQVKKFYRNKPAVIITSLYLLHLLGLLYTEDFQWALKDIRVKLPLLSLPILFSGLPKISRKEMYAVFSVHALAVFSGTIIVVFNYYQTYSTDIRELYPFISHIRFSLNVVLSIFAIGYIAFQKGFYPKYVKLSALTIVIWFILFLFIFKALSGIVIFLLISMVLLMTAIFKQKKMLLKIVSFVFLVGIPLLFGRCFVNSYTDHTKVEPIVISELDIVTVNGNRYKHDTTAYGIEEGRYIGLFLCKKELIKAWNKVSEISYYKKDKKNQYIRFTLIRYLNSKNLRKDAEGVSQLSKMDIENIENGIANYNYTLPLNIKARTDQIVMGFIEYTEHDNANRSSVMQRIEYWKTSYNIFSKNPFMGVGTGDVNLAFREEYKAEQTLLSEAFQLRSHNQYMAIAIAFGLFGLIWLLASFIIPALLLSAFKDYLFVIYFLIISFSMLWEDTLETQAGVTFVMFFFSLILFAQEKYRSA
ncbi:MAG: O-antigen ligase family protein [Bacteroidota bacterium]|nr:O-antigen ligase family protein [Bacteroidota bacterium]